MRDIKFRAYNFNLEVYAPDHANFNFGEEDCVVFDFFDGNFDTKVWGFDECFIEQYTGLKDKNGVEIYEGDILKTKTRIGRVVWDDGFCGFSLVTKSNELKSECIITHPTCVNCEVIGNTHENPELLK